jgi:hypothetical protein
MKNKLINHKTNLIIQIFSMSCLIKKSTDFALSDRWKEAFQLQTE